MSHQPHVTHYQILTDQAADRLSAQVEAAIHNGWQPWGPLTIAGGTDPKTPGALLYSQAVVQQSEWYR
ncbi:MAG: DUF1737 domain-containing protein [Rhodobacter sp.]|nr:DUF1737 domain-containing protein [Rhodobacter sp.]